MKMASCHGASWLPLLRGQGCPCQVGAPGEMMMPPAHDSCRSARGATRSSLELPSCHQGKEAYQPLYPRSLACLAAYLAPRSRCWRRIDAPPHSATISHTFPAPCRCRSEDAIQFRPLGPTRHLPPHLPSSRYSLPIPLLPLISSSRWQQAQGRAQGRGQGRQGLPIPAHSKAASFSPRTTA